MRVAAVVVLAAALYPATIVSAQQTAPGASPTPKKGAPTKPAPKPSTAQLQKRIEEQRAMIEAQTTLIAEQQARLADAEARLQAQQDRTTEQQAALQAQAALLQDLQAQLAALTKHLEELQAAMPGAEERKALEERLKKMEEEAKKVPELPPDVVSAGDFPGSIKIPGTDAAVKFGGRIRTAGVFTLDDLGSDDRFLTNSIPVETGDAAAGKGPRTTFTANTSRFNFEMRTPAGDSQMRAFIEGDFFGTDGNGNRTAFRLRHAYAQFKGMVVGQTWSTFSDPAANHQDLDFEGINGENLIRQPQFRYNWVFSDRWSFAAAAETPQVSLTGGQGVNVIPDLVARSIWKFKEVGHLQGAAVVRQIRGESELFPGETEVAWAWGASLSGVVPFRYFHLLDRFIFQLNVGEGNARYINDLNSLDGQDAVFNPVTGKLEVLPAKGFYLDYEHQWKEWARTQAMKLRSSFIWSFVDVNNLSFQAPDAYHQTNRYSVNVVFSPIDRIDIGVEYIYGTRENKDGNSGSSDQFQMVGIFRF
ncbi:MAG TPA: DcaP family trimeric outer membrane transporter [Candidatus Polarisedimenticolia bacterium]|nr:DcaP family trimeric outer membrane transporter [Candidatus Polarisedimenticolia bacterium]